MPAIARYPKQELVLCRCLMLIFFGFLNFSKYEFRTVIFYRRSGHKARYVHVGPDKSLPKIQLCVPAQQRQRHSLHASPIAEIMEVAFQGVPYKLSAYVSRVFHVLRIPDLILPVEFVLAYGKPQVGGVFAVCCKIRAFLQVPSSITIPCQIDGQQPG